MKKFVIFLVFAMAVANVFAQSNKKELKYTSSTTGITFHVPANVKEFQDNIEAVILQTPDKEYTITAEAFNVEKTSQEDIAKHITYMAEAAKIDLEKSESIESKGKFVTLFGEAMDYENGGAAAVGVAVVNDTKLGYYITVVASPNYVDYAVSSLTTIDFDPDAIE